MAGPVRALVYRLAIATGLRYGEIASTTRSSYELAGGHPAVIVRAGYAKNGDPARLTLPRDVADDLSSYLAGAEPGSPAFPLPDGAVDMLRIDLEAAGIPYRDEGGLVFDFHALRCQCATLADQAGASPRVVQKLIRHSTLELTGRYTRPRLHDIKGAASALPSPRPGHPGPRPCPTPVRIGQPIKNRVALPLPHAGDAPGRELTQIDGREPPETKTSQGSNPLGSSGLDASCRPGSESVASAPRRTRTYNPLIKSQLLWEPLNICIVLCDKEFRRSPGVPAHRGSRNFTHDYSILRRIL
jgi:hypothetical protein